MEQDNQKQFRSPQEGAQEHENMVSVFADALMRVARSDNAGPLQENAEGNSDSIDLMELFFHILSKIHYVVLAAVLGALLSFLYLQYLYVPRYQATAKLYILNSGDISVSMADIQVASNLTMDYQEVFSAWEVHEMVRSDLGLDYSYQELEQMLSVSNPSNTRLLYITVTHEDPQMAMNIANAYSRAAMNFIYQVLESEEPNIFSVALEPTVPVGMSKTKCLIMGCILGAFVVLLVLALQFLLDDRPRTPDDITRMTGVPTLAIIPRELSVDKARRRSRKARKEGAA